MPCRRKFQKLLKGKSKEKRKSGDGDERKERKGKWVNRRGRHERRAGKGNVA